MVPAGVLVLHRWREHHHQDGGGLRRVAGARPDSAASRRCWSRSSWVSGGAVIRLARQEDRAAHAASSSAIGVYTGAAVYAYFLDSEREFYRLAVVIGLVQGGVQSLSRSLYGRLVPAAKTGEFFGFYNLMGKAAAILGPMLTGVVALTTHDSRLAIVSISILFIIGAVFLSRVKIPANSN